MMNCTRGIMRIGMIPLGVFARIGLSADRSGIPTSQVPDSEESAPESPPLPSPLKKGRESRTAARRPQVCHIRTAARRPQCSPHPHRQDHRTVPT